MGSRLRGSRRFAAGAAILLTAAWPLRAASVVWNGSDLTWTAPDSNSFGASTYNNGDDASFTNTGAGSIAVTGGGVAPNALSFTNTSGANYTFTGGALRLANGLTMTGGGNVLLNGTATGVNSFGGPVQVSAGILQAVNNDQLRYATLTIASGATFTFNNYEYLGSLAGAGTLTNTAGNTSLYVGYDNTSTAYSGTITWAGGGGGNGFNKVGSGTLTFSGIGTSIGNGVFLQGGGLTLTGTNGNFAVSTSTTTSQGTTLTLDNSGANNASRIGDSGLTLNGGEFVFNGNGGVASSEGSNTITFGPGAATVTINPGAGQSATINQAWNNGDLLVNAGSSALIRGPNLGTVAGPNVAVFQAWDFDIPSRQKGGAGAAGNPTVNLFPHLVGDTTAAGDGAGFITFAATSPTIARLLNTATEYAGTITSGSAVLNNVRLTGAVSGINAPTTINALLLTAGSSVAGSGSLSLNANDILATGAGTGLSVATLAFGALDAAVRVTSGSSLNISSQITGSSANAYGLTKGGSGNLILSGTGNSYTKLTQINAGQLTVAAAGVLGTTGTGNGTVVMRGATLAFDSGVNYTTAEAVTLSGTGVGGAGAIANISGANSFAGQVTLAAASTLGTTAGTLTLTAPVLGNFMVDKVGAGTLRLDAPIASTAGISLSQGTVLAGAADVLLAGPVTVAAGGTFDANGYAQHLYSLAGPAGSTINLGGATLTVGHGNTSTAFAGAIGGAGASGVAKIGSGTLTLTGANSYAGATTIDSGTLALSGTGTLGGTSVVTANAGGTLTVDNTVTNSTDRIADSAVLTVAGGNLNVLGNAGAGTSETVGNVTWGGTGGAVVTLTPGSGQSAVLTGGALTVAPRGTTLVRGTGLGSALGAGVAQVKFTGAVPTVGGGGAGGTTTVNTIAHTVGDSSATGVGTGFVTYDAANGVRLLTGAEYAGTISSGGSTLTNVSLNYALSGINAATAINSLRLQSGGSVAGTGVLTINSGDIMGAATGTTLSMTTLAFGTAQGTFYTPVATDTLAVTGTMTGTGGIAKGGAGTVTFSGATALPNGPVSVAGGMLDISSGASRLPVLGALYVAPGATLRYNNSERVGSLAGGGTLIGTVGNNYFWFGTDNTDTTFSGSFTITGGWPGEPGTQKVGKGTTTIMAPLGTFGSALGVTDGTLRFYGNGSTNNYQTTASAEARVVIDDTLTHVDNRTGQTTVAGEYIVLGNKSASSAIGGPNNTAFFFSGPGSPTLTLMPGNGFEAQYAQRNGGNAGQFTVGAGVVALVRGDGLGQTTGTRSRFTLRTIDLNTLMIGGAGQKLSTWSGGGQGTPQVSVLYRTYADDSSTGLGKGFVTYQPTGSVGNSGDQVPETDVGVRLLTASEYATTIADGAGAVLSTIANTKLASAVSGINSATQVNSLVLDQGGSVAGSGTLTVYSGLIMSTGTNGAITTTGLAVPAITSNSQISLITPAADDQLSVSSAVTGTGGLVKAGAGTVVLTGSNSYSGTTYIANGALRASSGVGLPANSNLCFAGGVLESSGTFSRSLGAGTANVQWDASCSGGFAANGGALSIQLNGGTAAVTWDNTASFVQGHRSLILGSVSADNVVNVQNALSLGTFDIAAGDRTDSTVRSIRVVDNPNSAADYAQISGLISGADATLALSKEGDGLLVLSGSNTYSGNTRVLGGVLRAADGVGLPTGATKGNLEINGGVWESSTDMARVGGSALGQMRITGGSSGFSAAAGSVNVAFGGVGAPTALVWGSAPFQPADLILNAATAAGTLDFRNPVDLSNGGSPVTRTISVAASTATMSGALTQSGTGVALLRKTGPGTLVLTGANSYTGGTTIGAGTLGFASGALGSAGGITFAASSTLRWETGNAQDISSRIQPVPTGIVATFDTGLNTVPLASALSGLGGIGKAGTGTLVLTGANSYSGGTTLGAGTLGFANGSLGSTGGITFAASSTLRWETGNSQDVSGRIQSLGSGVTATFDTNGNTVAFAGSLAGAGGVVKAGANKLTFNGAQSYTGGTTLNAGTLEINSTLAGDVTVNAGTLAGTGSIAGSVNLLAGNLTPGSSPGVLDIGGNLTLGQLTTVTVELGGGTPGDGAGFYDQVNVGGSATLGGGFSAALYGGYVPSSADVFYVLTRGAGSGTFDLLPEGSTIPFGIYSAQITYLANWTGTQAGSSASGGNDVAIYGFVVPEPTAGLLLMLAAGAAATRRRQSMRPG